jgi:hypothetical protein
MATVSQPSRPRTALTFARVPLHVFAWEVTSLQGECALDIVMVTGRTPRLAMAQSSAQGPFRE